MILFHFDLNDYNIILTYVNRLDNVSLKNDKICIPYVSFKKL